MKFPCVQGVQFPISNLKHLYNETRICIQSLFKHLSRYDIIIMVIGLEFSRKRGKNLLGLALDNVNDDIVT